MSALTEAQAVRAAKYAPMIAFIANPVSGMTNSYQQQLNDLADMVLDLAGV
jgi:hypothetical protein